LVSTSNVTIDIDLEVSAVAEVEEVLNLFISEVVDGIIGLEEGLKDALCSFRHGKRCNL
jgi:hypothetical protein